MKELEFDVTLEDEDLFDDESYDTLVEEFDKKKLVPPKKAYLLDKQGLAELTRSSLKEERLKKKDGVIEQYTPEFKKAVEGLCDNAVEWCNHAAQSGEWSHVYDMDKVDKKYFLPTMRAIRLKMTSVIILVEEKRRRLTIEWGNNEK